MSNFLEVDSTALEHNLRVVKNELEDDFDSFFGSSSNNNINTENDEPARTFKIIKPEPEIVCLEEKDEIKTNDDVHTFIVRELEKFQIILNTSQMPILRKRKIVALHQLTENYKKKFDENISTKQMTKKISNMKGRLSHKKNHKIKEDNLKKWEKDLAVLIAAVNKKRIKGTFANRMPPKRDHFISSSSNIVNVNSVDPTSIKPISSNTAINPADILRKYETEETSCLSNIQLERLVLLKKNQVLSQKLCSLGVNSK